MHESALGKLNADPNQNRGPARARQSLHDATIIGAIQNYQTQN
jgi:hypothetical protein